jgi:hypothetical protein
VARDGERKSRDNYGAYAALQKFGLLLLFGHGTHGGLRRCASSEPQARIACAEQAARQVGEPRFHLPVRPFLPQHDCTTFIVAHDVERVLADIDADHGNPRIDFL